ncbi:50S ribosomal protein L24 [Candidatus Nesciobacter abundans]|uniref:Large ribosomal subunit protein uL24 n=1 Tax=Candidatus Nesciobacter abundans TaxID=2601668 RepID=A0A5C0UHS0_9PROT|nr:50S ribosomal protein L24 [Candidatus Nesciobacter abundans]QEK38912.1 50S ribosomal protein L24 [Candidatus Nesciobacter abundans]
MKKNKNFDMNTPKFKIKKGDIVMVISGKNKGSIGPITKMFPKECKALVENINTVKVHQKPSQGQPGSIVEKTMPIHISNLSHVESGKPAKVCYKIDGEEKTLVFKKSGKKVRV